MNAWLRSNDFTGMTFFGQDWGGLIGLRMIADNDDRFDRVVISNTGLPYQPDTPDDVVAEVEDFRANKPTPTLPQMMKAIRRGARARVMSRELPRVRVVCVMVRVRVSVLAPMSARAPARASVLALVLPRRRL